MKLKKKTNQSNDSLVFSLIVMVISAIQFYLATNEIIIPIIYILLFSMNYFLFSEFKRHEMISYKIIAVFSSFTFLYIVYSLHVEEMVIYYFTFVFQFVYLLSLEKKVFYTAISLNTLYQTGTMVYFLHVSGIEVFKETVTTNFLGFGLATVISLYIFHRLERRNDEIENDTNMLTLKSIKLETDLHNLYFSKENTSEIVYQFHQFIYNLENSKMFFEKLLNETKRETDISKTKEVEVNTTLNSLLSTVTDLKGELEKTQNFIVSFQHEADKQLDFITEETRKAELLLSYNDTNNDDLNHLMDSTSTVYSLIELIRGISNQINLLSLNAAIEASKSGESGKRFSVIAKEIKNLQIEVLSILQNITTEISTIERSSLNIKEGNKSIEKKSEEILSSKHDSKKISEKVNSFLKELMLHEEINSQKFSSSNSDLNNALKRIDDIINSNITVHTLLEESSIYFVQQKKITNELKKVLEYLHDGLVKTSHSGRNKKE